MFIETLDELQWMDEASKEKAREKVRDNKELQYSVVNMKSLEFVASLFPVPLQMRGQNFGVHYLIIHYPFLFNPLLAHIHFYSCNKSCEACYE